MLDLSGLYQLGPLTGSEGTHRSPLLPPLPLCFLLPEFFRQRPDSPWSATMLGWFREESRLAAVLLDEIGWETITRVGMEGVGAEWPQCCWMRSVGRILPG